MSPNTKRKVTWVRIVQLVLRFLALLSALAMLVFIIFIKPAGDGSDWIVRVPVSLGSGPVYLAGLTVTSLALPFFTHATLSTISPAAPRPALPPLPRAT